MHSIIQCGSIPGGKSLKRNRHSVFLTAVNPMYTYQHQEEAQYDLDKPRIAMYEKTWKIHPNTVYWCNLKLVQRKGLQFYQTRSNAITLFFSLLAICIEKVVFMKTGRELYSKVYQFPRLSRRTILTPKLHHGRQDLSHPKARTSSDHRSKTKRGVRGDSQREVRGDSKL